MKLERSHRISTVQGPFLSRPYYFLAFPETDSYIKRENFIHNLDVNLAYIFMSRTTCGVCQESLIASNSRLSHAQ